MAERHSSTHSSDKFSSFVVDSAIIENVNSTKESANNIEYIPEEDVEEEDGVKDSLIMKNQVQMKVKRRKRRKKFCSHF